MDRDELLAAAKRKQLLAAARQKQAQQAEPEPEAVAEETVVAEPEDRGAVSGINDRVQAFTQGLTLNSMDEIGSAALAGLKPAINWAAGAEQDDSTYGERYDKYHQQYQDDRERFADENPAEALALEVGGGFMLPGGAVKNLKNASRLKKVLSGTGRGLVEGTIAGTMAADQGDRGTGAALGGSIGAVLPGALNSVTGAAGTVARRRLATEIGDEAGQVPIHRVVGEDSALPGLYRSILGRVTGGKNKLIGQDAPFLDAAKEGVQKEIRQVEKNVDVNRAKQVLLKKMRQEGADEIDVGATRQLNTIDERAVKEAADIDAAEALQKQGLTDDLTQQFKDKQDAFSRDAIDDSMTDSMSRELRDEIRGLNPREAESKISEWWRDNGFGMVKDRTFQWDGSLKKEIRGMINNDPVLLNNIGKSMSQIDGIEKLFGGPVNKALTKTARKKAAKQFEAIGNDLTPSGKQMAEILNDESNVMIDGAALMELRNVFARASNKGARSQAGKGQRTVADRFDSMISKQLGKDSDKYFGELARWPSKQALSTATRTARKQGRDFNAKDWVRASNSADTPLRKMGEEIIEAPAAAKAISTEQKEIIKKANTEIRNEAKKKVAAAKRAVGDETRALKRTNAARGGNKAGAKLRLRKAKKRLTDARSELTDAKALSIPKDSSGWSEIMLTGALGSLGGVGALVGGPIGSLAAMGTGTAIGKGLTSIPGQRIVAGQTGLQGNIRDWAANKTTRELARRLRQTSARQAAGTAGEQ